MCKFKKPRIVKQLWNKTIKFKDVLLHSVLFIELEWSQKYVIGVKADESEKQ